MRAPEERQATANRKATPGEDTESARIPGKRKRATRKGMTAHTSLATIQRTLSYYGFMYRVFRMYNAPSDSLAIWEASKDAMKGMSVMVSHRGPSIRANILHYLAQNAGVTVWRKDVADGLGISEDQVTSSIGGILKVGSPASRHIIVIDRGRAWRWTEFPVAPYDAPVPTTEVTPPVPEGSAKRVFEELAVVPDGRILIQDESRIVYWASKVE